MTCGKWLEAITRLPLWSAAGVRSRRVAVATALSCAVAGPSFGADYQTRYDPPGDAVVRKTGSGRVKPGKHRLPDLLSITVGTWQPDEPVKDLFTGTWDRNADTPFLRVDVVLDGLMNPPGPFLHKGGGVFDPFRFGPHPVFGFIELDADENVDTGGEIKFPENRHLGTAARFGGIPSEVHRKLKKRFALSAADFDHNCNTPPFVEYTGEEFHLALLGEQYAGHTVVVENPKGRKGKFDAGEVWDLKDGTWFHRAHGFKGYSTTCPGEPECPGNPDQGEYKPPCTIRWSHDIQSDPDQTTITLVFPLTHRAANAILGNPGEEPLDRNYLNQASVHEALTDLLFSARANNPQGPCVELILEWANTDPQDHLGPHSWGISAVLSTSYVRKADRSFVWTDLYPNSEVGDFDGDGDVDLEDYDALYGFIHANDGGKIDGDGMVNGEVELIDYSWNFSVFDIDYDGVVGDNDAAVIIGPHDMDQDLDVDLEDLSAFVVCLDEVSVGPRAQNPLGIECLVADSDFDGDVDLTDFGRFQRVFTGPDP